MKRAGSSITLEGVVSGVGVTVYNTGSISREVEGHEHTLAIGSNGVTVHVTPAQLRAILAWYDEPDENEKARKD